MINRKNEDFMRNFFLNDNRALLVTGARQTGKTFSIRRVGKQCFSNFVEINFFEFREAVELFRNFTNADNLLMRLSAITKTELVPGKTLIFFDEVQECPEIVTCIKFLVDEGSYKYVLSGSLLGVELKDVKSIPVGYMKVLDMYPLDLEEFANALGVGERIFSHLRECFNKQQPVDDFIHKRMLDLVQLYLVVGGMPAVVKKYIETNNLRKVFDLQNDIVRLYRMDIGKYDPTRKLSIEEIFNLIPSELNAKNKRFILKELNEKSRFAKYENSFLWLTNAGVAIPTYSIEEPALPLLLSKQRNLFKLFLNDVGLLASMYAGDIQTQILSNNSDINFGSVYENLVAQELTAHGFSGDGHNLYYFNSKKQGELDFVLEVDGKVVPIEVKSGKDFRRHNALTNVLTSTEYTIDSAIVFCNGNLEAVGKVLYLPIYMLMFFQKKKSRDVTFKFDLTGLN